MKKMLNREVITGRIYEHNLALKVTGESSKAPGTEYIGGTIDIATDDECLNIVTVNFTYVTEKYSSGKTNATFGILKNIINNGKTVLIDGKDSATIIKVDASLGLNDFYTNRDGEETLVSAKRNEGSFVNTVAAIKPTDVTNKFEFDILINGTKVVEADPEKNIPADYLIVKGAIFNFRNAILPVELVVKDAGGMKYFESLEASSTNLILTKVWGSIECQTIVNKKEEEAAFGNAAVSEYTRTVKQWVITGAAKVPYEFGEDEVLTADEVKKALEDRNVYLADVKKRQEEYQATKAASTPAPAGNVSAAAGGFNF